MLAQVYPSHCLPSFKIRSLRYGPKRQSENQVASISHRAGLSQSDEFAARCDVRPPRSTSRGLQFISFSIASATDQVIESARCFKLEFGHMLLGIKVGEHEEIPIGVTTLHGNGFTVWAIDTQLPPRNSRTLSHWYNG